MKSVIVNKANEVIAKVQDFATPLRNNSVIIKNIEDGVFALTSLLLILSTFCNTDILGLVAIGIILLGGLRLILIDKEKLQPSAADGALLIFLLFLMFSTFNSTLPKYSLEGLIKYLIYIGYYFAVVPMFRRKKKKVLYLLYTK